MCCGAFIHFSEGRTATVVARSHEYQTCVVSLRWKVVLHSRRHWQRQRLEGGESDRYRTDFVELHVTH